MKDYLRVYKRTGDNVSEQDINDDMKIKFQNCQEKYVQENCHTESTFVSGVTTEGNLSCKSHNIKTVV